jgi:hypothetical protein
LDLSKQLVAAEGFDRRHRFGEFRIYRSHSKIPIINTFNFVLTPFASEGGNWKKQMFWKSLTFLQFALVCMAVLIG